MIPHCDISTGKIYGCKPETKSWYHEKGHLEFNKIESTSRLKLYQGYAFWFWMLSLTIAVLNKYMLFLSFPLLFFYLGVDLYEEIWCNTYANQNYKVLPKSEN